MQRTYIRYGRRYSIPSTAQILDELKTGFVPGYVPVSGGDFHGRDWPQGKTTESKTDETAKTAQP